jgi:FAD:protein FMN transferase
MRRCSCLLLLALLLSAGCDRPAQDAPRQASQATVHTETRYVFGPVAASIQVVAADAEQAGPALDAAFAALTQANNLFSSHLPTSEISRLNAAEGEPRHLSAQTLALLGRALELGEQTGGAFDITAGPLIRLWKAAIRSGKLPSEADREAARKRVGYHQVALDRAASRARLVPGMSLDLGGIAKGFAVDAAVAALRGRHLSGGIVDAGGDGYAMGTRPDGAPWRIGIQHPRSVPGNRLPEVLLLSDRAYATSGDYEQYTEIDGVRYHHVIDPRTGEPAHTAVSVTVVASDCTTADALATALLVLGPEDGIALVETLRDVECMIVREGQDGLAVAFSSGFRALTADGTSPAPPAPSR